MPAYYNENNAYAAQWLRNLIAAGHIAAGDVDERSIEDVSPDDIAGYGQCHFFAGIGGWSYALRLAGVPDDVPVWTGSCPCQPFSVAGKQRGVQDERHLWPVWFRLIRKRRPRLIFGEQVASDAALAWWDGVCANLEGADYACAAASLPAACVGAPHIRQRIYWLADCNGNGREAAPFAALHDAQHYAESCGGSGLLADTNDARPQGRIYGGAYQGGQLSTDTLDVTAQLATAGVVTARGEMQAMSFAATGNGARLRLNPAFSRWLQGFPQEWDACAPTETPSSRKSLRLS